MAEVSNNQLMRCVLKLFSQLASVTLHCVVLILPSPLSTVMLREVSLIEISDQIGIRQKCVCNERERNHENDSLVYLAYRSSNEQAVSQCKVSVDHYTATFGRQISCRRWPISSIGRSASYVSQEFIKSS